MEKIENSEELKKNANDILICNDTNKYKKKVKKFYTCEEKWNTLQALKTMSPELVCAKFNVELALLKRWTENSVIICQELRRSQLSSDSNHETDSSSNCSGSDMPESLITREQKEEFLKDFEVLTKKDFLQKYKINKYLLHILIVQKLQMKEISEKNHIKNPQMNQNQNFHNEFIDCNVTNYLSPSTDFQKSNRGYKQKELTRMKLGIQKAQKLTKYLHDWYFQMQQKGIFVAEFMLREEATRLAKTLCYSKFRATNTWLNLWYEIYNINVRTINKSAEYFDRSFLFENTDIARQFSKKHVQETYSRPMDTDWIERQEEIDNVGEDLYFWYDEIIKEGKLVSDLDLCTRAEQVSIALNDRPFFPDIVWLYKWKKQYNIQCAETEWKLFKLSKWQYKKRKNIKKNCRYSKTRRLRLCKFSKSQLSSSSSSIEYNVSKKTCQMDLRRPF